MAHQQLSGESQLSGLDHCTIDSLPSLRQVLTELRRLSDAQSDAQSPCSTATSAKPIRLVPFPSEPRSGSSPLLQSDEQLRRHSPKARLAPFWGPGLTPADPTSVPSNSPHSSSILSRLQRLCSGERNLRTTASRDNDEASGSSNSSSSSKLWHFDLCMSEDVLRSMFYKRLCWRLGACSAKESLIAEAIQASSTDNDEERIQNVLQPSARMRGFFNACYWSSGPSNEVDSSEALDFKLAHPVCVVHEVHLQPFKAYFQPGQPLYPSKSVRFHFASSLQQLEGATGENSSSCTAEYPVENSDSLQRFIIPPMLCIGGFVRVELIGRVQRQREDNRYYTCICYVKIVGTPVYGFLPSPTQPSRSLDVQPLVLRAVLQDPLLVAGGLRRVSEMGRLLLEQHLMDDAASDHDSLHGDSDDGDFAAEVVLDGSDNEDPMDLAHGVGLQMGAHLAHVPIHELLGGHLGGIDDDDGEYPLIYE
ncbi:MAG: hypothetical protein FRX49_07412 [Trebouxia sp. A1-2]|nr:MAG: hypothetical protein FRX49_07412 [Trebouxia sp. A1-2]